MELNNNQETLNEQLFKFVQANDIEKIKKLIDEGADVSSFDKDLRLPLHFAAKLDDPEILKYLISKGSVINYRDTWGNLPLHVAVNNNKLEAVKILVENGANLNLENKFNLNPLDIAVMTDNGEEILHFLVKQKKKIDFTYVLLDKKNEFYEYKRYRVFPSWITSDREKDLYSKKAELYEKYYEDAKEITTIWSINQHEDKYRYRTVNDKLIKLRKQWLWKNLITAVETNDIEKTKKLVGEGADVNCLDYKYRTPLHFAAKLDDPEILKYLISEGSAINYKDTWGNSPLHVAVNNNKLEAVKILIEKGADLNLENIYYFTPIDVAVKRDKNSEILSLLVKQKKITDPEYILLDKKNELYEYENNNLYPDWITTREEKILYDIKTKIYKKYYEDAKEITTIWSINQHEDKGKYHFVNKSLWKIKKTWLQKNLSIGIKKNNKDQIIKMLEQGADINIKDLTGRCPIHLAVELKNLEILQYLIDENANVNPQDNEGNTPLHLAVDNEDLVTVKILVEKGADIDLKNNAHFTPLDIAIITEKNDEILQFLVKQKKIINPKYILLDEKNEIATFKNFNKYPEWVKKMNIENIFEKRANIYIENYPDNKEITITKKVDDNQEYNNLTEQLRKSKNEWIQNLNTSSKITNQKETEEEIDTIKDDNFIDKWNQLSRNEKISAIVFTMAIIPITISVMSKKEVSAWISSVNKELSLGQAPIGEIEEINMEQIEAARNNILENMPEIIEQVGQAVDNNVHNEGSIINVNAPNTQQLPINTLLPVFVPYVGLPSSVFYKIFFVMFGVGIVGSSAYWITDKNVTAFRKIKKKGFLSIFSSDLKIEEEEMKKIYANIKKTVDKEDKTKNEEIEELTKTLKDVYNKYSNLEHKKDNTQVIKKTEIKENQGQTVKNEHIPFSNKNLFIIEEKINNQNRDFLKILYNSFFEIMSDMDESNNYIQTEELKKFINIYFLLYDKFSEFHEIRKNINNSKIDSEKKNFYNTKKIDLNLKKNEDLILKKLTEEKKLLAIEKSNLFDSFSIIYTNRKEKYSKNINDKLKILYKNLDFYEKNNFFFENIRYLSLKQELQKEILTFIAKQDQTFYVTKEKEEFVNKLKETENTKNFNILNYEEIQNELNIFLLNNLLDRKTDFTEINYSLDNKQVLDQLKEKLYSKFNIKIDQITDKKQNDKYQKSPLFYLQEPHILKFWINQGLDVNQKDIYNLTALFYAQTPEGANYLISKGANKNIKDNNDRSQLFYCKNYSMLLYWIDQGLDVNEQDIFNLTPLFFAQTPEMAEYLINKKNLDPNKKNNLGITPLFYAQTPEMAEYWVKKKINFNKKDFNLRTPLFYAQTPEMAEYWINKEKFKIENDRYDQSPLWFASNPDIARYWIDVKGLDPHKKDITGRTPLFYARTPEMAKFFIDRGLNLNEKDKLNNTPNFYAETDAMKDFWNNKKKEIYIEEANNFGKESLSFKDSKIFNKEKNLEPLISQNKSFNYLETKGVNTSKSDQDLLKDAEKILIGNFLKENDDLLKDAEKLLVGDALKENKDLLEDATQKINNSKNENESEDEEDRIIE